MKHVANHSRFLQKVCFTRFCFSSFYCGCFIRGKPPPNEDGTPAETLSDQVVRLTNLMSGKMIFSVSTVSD